MKTYLVAKSPENITGCKEHSHPHWEIVIPLYGTGTVIVPDQEFAFSGGSVYITPPNMKHKILSDSCYQDIHILCDDLPFSGDSLYALNHLESLTELGQLLFQLYLKREQGYRTSLEELLRFMIQLILDTRQENKSGTLSYAIRDHLIRNFSNPALDMETLSGRFRYHPDYIRRCFKKDFGITPMEYLTDLKINQAKKLLRSVPQYSIGTIADQCGFPDPLYFSRCFRKAVGVSPREYRNMP